MQKSEPLLLTKLRPPFTRSSLVSRPRLDDQIAQGLRGPLTLITAPAGFGKTTLVASHLPACGMPVAWLSLDKDDNQAGRFLSYLVAALQEINPTIGGEAAQLVESQQASPEAIITSLINDLDTEGKEMILVLDDYHVISSQDVYEQVAFLIEHCPSTFHLVIATRSDPLLPLARLRARGQMVELRVTDLSFTDAEASQFLNDVMGLRLDAGSVSTLQEHTEGWIAGLQMAALSMRDYKDVTGFIEKFSGTSRYILDYLLEEVLAAQPPEIQRFLLHTSILDRLTAPLCDALLQDEASSLTLDYLERANLFLVPLDDERTWYRYHHLFADLLRTRLSQVHPGLRRQLHVRAAAWLEREGMTVDAINHTLSAGEYDHAARLVEENTTRLLAQGELNALMGWIEMLPADLRLARPWLCVHQAYALLFAGQSAEVGRLLAQAEAVLELGSAHRITPRSGQPDQTGALLMDMAEVRALRGAVAAVRAFSTAIMVQDAEALDQAQRARDLLLPGDLFDQSLVAFALGYLLHSQGRLAEARSAFEEQIRLSRIMQNDATLMIGLTALARVLADQGKLNQERVLLEETLAEARQKGARNLGFITRLETYLAGVLCEQNKLEAAHHLLSDALNHGRFWLNPNHLVSIHVYLAHVQLAEGDFQEAWSTVSEADRIRRRTQLSPWLENSLEAAIVWIWLALQAGGMEFVPSDLLAERSRLLLTSWRNELTDRAESRDPYMDLRVEAISLILARESLISGQIDEALSLLEPVVCNAKTAGHLDIAIGALIRIALAYQKKAARDTSPMLTVLEEVLSLAEPGGYVRVFLNEGASMQKLLVQWLAHAGASPFRDYALQLLSQFGAETHQAAVAPLKVSLAGNLVEPLSPRELEVLQLMALGKTNQEIAEQLVVAVGTVKSHAASIYRKLETANRTEAVNRARQLGLLLGP
jgi:LuxR family transcriptional regulator, maltose regulon positive regulatory protein